LAISEEVPSSFWIERQRDGDDGLAEAGALALAVGVDQAEREVDLEHEAAAAVRDALDEDLRVAGGVEVERERAERDLAGERDVGCRRSRSAAGSGRLGQNTIAIGYDLRSGISSRRMPSSCTTASKAS
jgi:hypothetical protein